MQKYYVAQFNKKGNLNMGGATGHDTMEEAMNKAQSVLKHATSDAEVLLLTPVGKIVYEDTPVKYIPFEDKTIAKQLGANGVFEPLVMARLIHGCLTTTKLNQYIVWASFANGDAVGVVPS